jgi:hypothetical protein
MGKLCQVNKEVKAMVDSGILRVVSMLTSMFACESSASFHILSPIYVQAQSSAVVSSPLAKEAATGRRADRAQATSRSQGLVMVEEVSVITEETPAEDAAAASRV